MNTFEIITNNNGIQGITCAGCKRTSWHPKDVEHKWCVCRKQTHPINLDNLYDNLVDCLSDDKQRSREAFTRINKIL